MLYLIVAEVPMGVLFSLCHFTDIADFGSLSDKKCDILSGSNTGEKTAGEGHVSNDELLRNPLTNGSSDVEECLAEMEYCEGGGRFVCDNCGHRTTRPSRLKQHKRIHSEKSFLCDLCDYRTNLVGNLKAHKMRHTDEKLFECDQCDYTTNWTSALKRHKIKHTGEMPFVCDQCDYRTTWTHDLKRHMRRHSGVKLFMCDQCDFRASQASNLKAHKRTHSGEKPYECDQCHYRSNQLSALKRHKKKHAFRSVCSATIPSDMRMRSNDPFVRDYRVTWQNH
ncbi:hypothetical protein AAG570_007047 [Ranatra chinensis]|uniref:C2H2-type domain-containing protein n=1 Tax=Ranatra chinensis TaxID=642074 RepID=A0ABD0XUQ8_9HEMI